MTINHPCFSGNVSRKLDQIALDIAGGKSTKTFSSNNLSANFKREIRLLFWLPNSSLAGISFRTAVYKLDLPQQQWQMKVYRDSLLKM